MKTFYKILLAGSMAISLVFLPFSTGAIEVTKHLTFAWDDTNRKGIVTEFNLKVSPNTGGPYSNLATIPSNGNELSYQEEVSVTVNGPNGSTVPLYFVMDATDGNLISDLSDEAFYAFVVPGVATEIIVDNTDSGFSRVGTWATGSSPPGFYGTNFRWAPDSDGYRNATWSFMIDTPGEYELFARWASGIGSEATAAKYLIYSDGVQVGESIKDQTANGGQFNSLGIYTLSSGSLKVILWQTSSGRAIADAIRVEPVIDPKPEPEPCPEPEPVPDPVCQTVIFSVCDDALDSLKNQLNQ